MFFQWICHFIQEPLYSDFLPQFMAPLWHLLFLLVPIVSCSKCTTPQGLHTQWSPAHVPILSMLPGGVPIQVPLVSHPLVPTNISHGWNHSRPVSGHIGLTHRMSTVSCWLWYIWQVVWSLRENWARTGTCILWGIPRTPWPLSYLTIYGQTAAGT